MNKNTLIALLKLGIVSDAAGQAITMWTTGPLRLFDKPIIICPSMDSLGASNKPISFGDHSKVVRREVLGSLKVRAYNERYAEYYQFGYSATWRVSAAFMKPSAAGSPLVSQSPCKLVVCHA
jgi:HK97 family phage major capsid protein